MAVKTQIGFDKICALCGPYGIGAVLGARGIGRGSVQTNYRIEAERGGYVFRLYENRTREQVDFELETLAVLAGKGFPCPKPRIAKGASIGEYAGKPFALFHVLEGEHAQEWNDERRRSAARTAARMALLLCGFQPAQTAQRWNYGPELCERLAQEYAQKYGKEEKLRWYLEELSRLELPPELPMSVCHTDWDLGNLFFEGNEVSALLDFDDANYTYAAYDLAALTDVFVPGFRHDTWQTFAPDADIIDLSMARMLAAAYEQVRPLEEIEKEHLFDMVKLSVLIDCLWFFGRGDSDFYENRKIGALDRLGRAQFRKAVFDA